MAEAGANFLEVYRFFLGEAQEQTYERRESPLTVAIICACKRSSIVPCSRIGLWRLTRFCCSSDSDVCPYPDYARAVPFFEKF